MEAETSVSAAPIKPTDITITRQLNFDASTTEILSPVPNTNHGEWSAPSPTINTKEALAEVMAMFGSSTDQIELGTPGSPEATSVAKMFSCFGDPDAEHTVNEQEAEFEENGENVAPSEYFKPGITAAAEAAKKTGTSRGVCYRTAPFLLCSL